MSTRVLPRLGARVMLMMAVRAVEEEENVSKLGSERIAVTSFHPKFGISLCRKSKTASELVVVV